MTTRLRITSGTGLHLKFDNGVTFSIQIGGGSYSDNYRHRIGLPSHENPLPSSQQAEIAVWDTESEWAKFKDGGAVEGYVSLDRIINLIPILRGLPDKPSAKLLSGVLKENQSTSYHKNPTSEFQDYGN